MSNKSSSGLGGGINLAIGLIAIVIIAAIGWYYRFSIVRWMSSSESPNTYTNKSNQRKTSPSVDAQGRQGEDIEDLDFLPSANGEIVKHTFYTLSYLEEHEIPEWVAYEMDRTKHNAPNIGRYDRFHPDPKVSTQSASHGDYSGSGYTRGHMAPAGDMAFNATAMQETFYMSNMCPQVREFNNGVWKELEENIRDWTYKAENMFIITGPVLSDPIKKIGRNQTKITVPSAFYKVLYDTKNNRGIGFVIPHKRSEERLETYMVPIDEVERITGLNFFSNYFSDNDEQEIEANISPTSWKVSDKRYQLRIDKWNWE